MRSKILFRLISVVFVFAVAGTIFMIGEERIPPSVPYIAIGLWVLIYLGALIYRGKNQHIHGGSVAKLINGACVYVPWSRRPDWMLKFFGHDSFVWRNELSELREANTMYSVVVPLCIKFPTGTQHLEAHVRAEIELGPPEKLVNYFRTERTEIEGLYQRAVNDVIQGWAGSVTLSEQLYGNLVDSKAFATELETYTPLRAHLSHLGLRLEHCFLHVPHCFLTVQVEESRLPVAKSA